MGVELISQLQVAAQLLKAHIGTMTIRAVVCSARRGGELATLEAVGEGCLQGVVRAVANLNLVLYAILLHLAGGDVNHATHSA